MARVAACPADKIEEMVPTVILEFTKACPESEFRPKIGELSAQGYCKGYLSSCVIFCYKTNLPRIKHVPRICGK